MRSKEQQLWLQLTTLAQHYLPPQQRVVGRLTSLSNSGSSIITTNHLPLQETRMTQSEPEPHGSRDTFVPPPVKCNDAFIAEFEAALDKLTEESLSTTNNTMMTPSRWLELSINGGHITPLERIEGWHYCPRVDDKLTKMQNNLCKLCGADQGPDPLSLVVYDHNEPVPHLTDKEIETHLSDTTVSTKPPIVHQHNNEWYFWEETYSQRIGPYSTEIAANKALDHYCDVVLGQGRDPS